MQKQMMDQVLHPVRVTPSFKAELHKMCEESGIPASVLIRYSVQITIEKPSVLEEIIAKWRKEHNDGE